MTNRNIPAGLIALGMQKISLSGTTKYTLNSTCDGADAVIMSVETADVRAHFDGTNPGATTGVLFTSTASPYYLNLSRAGSLKITAASGSPVVNFAAFRYANNPAH